MDEIYKINMVSCLSKRLLYLRRYVLDQFPFFHVKIKLFVNKSDQDPDPHGSALVLPPGSGSGSELR
jgi:hypothetical protein